VNVDHRPRPAPAARTRRRGFASILGGSLVLAAGSLVGLAAPAQAATSLPCDLYGSAGSTCVAAYSSVRALFGSYAGNLYPVTRASDDTA